MSIAIALNSAYDAGIFSATASGNEGKTNAVLLPACASKAVSVGAVYYKSEASSGYRVCSDAPVVEDAVVCFSNRCVCVE